MRSKNLMVDGKQWPLIDTGAPIQYADFLTEAYYRAGIVHLSFAAAVSDGGNPSEAVVTTRLKIPVRLAWSLSQAINSIMQDVKKQTEQQKAPGNGTPGRDDFRSPA